MDNLTISAPDFQRVRKEAGIATEDAIRLLWEVTNQIDADRRRTVRESKEQDKKKVLISAATTNQDDFDADNASIVEFTGSSAFNLTGVRNPVEGQRLTLHNLGSGTITLKHNASSLAANRLFLDTAADKALAQNSSIMFLYLNGSWKELNLL